MDTRRNVRNYTMTRYHPNCRLCHYSGFSNLCTYSLTGECPYNLPTDNASTDRKTKARG